MVLSPKTKRLFYQIIPFGIISLLFSSVYTLIERGILGDHPVYPSTGNAYNFNLVFPAFTSFIVGCLIGIFEIRYLNSKFQRGSLIKKIVLKTSIYFIIIFIALAFIVIFSTAFELGLSPVHPLVWNDFTAFLSNFAFWTVLIYFSFGIVVCLFYNEVSDNIGQEVLLNFLTGKYHQPLEEERAYLFLDMKSSTTIAEKLGHVRYFTMLREYYDDLSQPIIEYGGEIYQYVGDEIVITWKVKKGFASDALACFFAMKKALINHSDKYEQKYGLTPSFKGGLHYGKVTTGEIGVIKKEITFSGDVLNTTARIQALCNSYNVELLASEKFIKALNNSPSYKFLELGETALRGRQKKINVFTVENQSLDV